MARLWIVILQSTFESNKIVSCDNRNGFDERQLSEIINMWKWFNLLSIWINHISVCRTAACGRRLPLCDVCPVRYTTTVLPKSKLQFSNFLHWPAVVFQFAWLALFSWHRVWMACISAHWSGCVDRRISLTYSRNTIQCLRVIVVQFRAARNRRQSGCNRNKTEPFWDSWFFSLIKEET